MSNFHGSESDIVRKSQLILPQTLNGGPDTHATHGGADGEVIRSGLHSAAEEETPGKRPRVAPKGAA